MYRPSLTTILSVAFMGYMANSIWTLAQLFFPPHCAENCMSSVLVNQPARRILLFTSLKSHPRLDHDLKFINFLDVGDATSSDDVSAKFEVPLPAKVKKNGTMYLCAFATPLDREQDPRKDWLAMITHPETSYTLIPLTQHYPKATETFNLLGKEEKEKSKKPKENKEDDGVPVTHLRSKVTLSLMSDDVKMPTKNIPPEFLYILRRSQDKNSYLPILYVDELSLRLRDLVVVNATDKNGTVEFAYKPISYGKLRLFLQFTGALSTMPGLGFSLKDTDEVKGIFADTNMTLLLVTFAVSAVHLLLDFLAFKNEITFWRTRKSMEGLSTNAVLWRAFSQAVVFLYLMDEETSLLVLIPSGIAAVIELWKVTKAFKIHFTWSSGWLPRVWVDSASQTESERSTAEFDAKAMKYLSYLLYPLVIIGAVYSLMYLPHKSWYSWTIQSTVNGVYAFGFLFMMPQLFVNYKLKSVAHLPWRAFTYKAFNTFIDDLFAFIITMPTTHRVACFRDDVVFFINLYQRWLYPVDKTRIDPSVGAMVGDSDVGDVSKKKEDKKNK